MLKLDGSGTIGVVDVPAIPCNGVFFKCYATSYVADGRFVFKQEFRLLKRMSCSGCDECHAFWEGTGNCDLEDILDLQSTDHGEIYQASYDRGTPIGRQAATKTGAGG